MEKTVTRKATGFRLNRELLNHLKSQAKKENRSLNNLVETILFEAVNRTPNEETLNAMREVESGVELEVLDMDNFHKYVSSL